MSYAEKNLLAGETIVLKAKVHWSIYMWSVFFFAASIVMFCSDDNDTVAYGIGVLMFAIYLGIKAHIYVKSTELVVTNKRLLVKVDMIRRDTVELLHSKVESLNLSQSVCGRMMDFGSLGVNGTGGGRTIIKHVEEPLAFRKAALETIEAGKALAT